MNSNDLTSNAVIVGIAGVTNGGKTSLCDRLLAAFPEASCLNMDNYFVHWQSDRLNMVEGLHHANWDELDAVDFEKLRQDVDAWLEAQPCHSDTKHLLLVEGIMIFNYKPLVPYFHKKYFLTLPRDECYRRRKLRKYFPPDPERYFESVVWPMYLQNFKDIQDQKDIVYIEGTGTKDSIFDTVHREVLTLVRCLDS